jgi:hypothetical protein
MFAAEFGHRQFHRAFDGQANHAFVLIDPPVSSELLRVCLAQRFEFFFPGIGPFVFVISAARCRADHCQYDYTEERKQQHDAEPSRKRSARLHSLAK